MCEQVAATEFLSPDSEEDQLLLREPYVSAQAYENHCLEKLPCAQ
jgi:hypothetical protein